jgi:hypothetical protein
MVLSPHGEPEHSLLADSLFTFVQAVGVYAAVRALTGTGLRWPLLSGFAIGVSFWLKTVVITSAVLVPTLLLCAALGNVRRRLISGATTAVAVFVVAFAYVIAQAYTSGYRGYLPLGRWNLYARVATFVDCSHFTPPKGTAFLCPPEPVGHRHNQAYFEHSPSSPAVRRFGRLTRAPPYANGVLQRFSVAAIEQEPIAYAKAILHGLTFFVSARPGEGYTPEQLRESLFDRTGNTNRRTISAYYSHARGAATLAAFAHSCSTRAIPAFREPSSSCCSSRQLSARPATKRSRALGHGLVYVHSRPFGHFRGGWRPL